MLAGRRTDLFRPLKAIKRSWLTARRCSDVDHDHVAGPVFMPGPQHHPVFSVAPNCHLVGKCPIEQLAIFLPPELPLAGVASC